MRERIDACMWLLLREIGEPGQNLLRLVIDEAKADGPPAPFRLGGVVVPDARIIEPDATCQAFELVWPDYVAYAVRNESYTADDPGEAWEGKRLRLYTKSHFLDHVARATFATADFPGPLQHWGIICLNHIIDVVAVAAPEIRLVHPADDAERARNHE